jgi:arabinogalactan oligomer/maltooligosaccharide transport system permease protein
MARAPRPFSHRRRFLGGLAAAALLAAAAGGALLAAARIEESRERAERQAVVTLLALTDVLDRIGGGAAEEPAYGVGEETGGTGIGAELAGEAPAAGDETGDAVRRAVARFAALHPRVTAVRVFDFASVGIAASSDPRDTGQRAAPRRLASNEKPLFDLGQKLRAAVGNNREGAEGSARAEELSVERLPNGGLRLAAPVERGGEVVGMAQITTAPAAAAPAFPWLFTLLAWLAPVLVLALLAPALGERRPALAAAAALLLLAALAGYAVFARRGLESDRRATGAALAATLAEEGKTTAGLIAELGLPAGPAPKPWTWDVDRYRQPYGLVTRDGVVDEGKLGETAGADARRLTRSIATLAGAALLLLAFAGWGWAARTGAALADNLRAYLYVLPAMLGMLVLVFFPFLYGVALSFTNANVYNTDKSVFETWTGLDNYGDILRDVAAFERTPTGPVFHYDNFYWTLGFTLVWTVTNVAIGVTLGLLLALALNTRNLAFRPVYRVLLILPWATPTYITSLVWKGMFHKQFGVVNQIFQIFGANPIAWFDRPLTSYLAVLTTNGWLSFPFMMVVSLGALQSIPADLYEAARVDGASRWQQFGAITLPSLRPALVPAIILSVIWTFNQFNVIYLVSAGEPAGATEILITQAYKLAFEQYRYGYAAAYSVVIFLILLVYGVFQNRVTRATEAIG